MSLYFTSDTHFGHKNIIQTCNRPFASVDEMDEAMVARWNQRVGPDDTVFHLGDFCFRNFLGADTYLRRLNGAIHLVQGNHDAETLKHHAGLFASVSLIREIEAGGHRIVMCHYPMREWDGSWTGSWHLFGHVHGRLNHAPLGFSLDVAADAHDFTPWSLDEIEAELKDRENPFAVHERPFRSQRMPSR
ncbi:metallophosphoesterase family protein [Rhodomicrobium sp.]|uniref:metallophosphoesterase family protein n=1 Tax=Rhodomicrobium sp. TaxID=2720632 RepID=UPI0039E6E146